MIRLLYILNIFFGSLMIATPVNSQSDLVRKIPCEAHAGRDTALCVSMYGLDTFYLGDPVVVTGGVPPFTYTWSGSYSYFQFHAYASNFLVDTSVANPALVNDFWEPFTFRLDVVDSEGTTCADSITIQFSQYGWTLDVKVRAILPGDSVQLYLSIFGGIPPYTYHWYPEEGLSDPTDPYTWASPDTTTWYNLTVTDSMGCVGEDNFQVIVLTTGVEEISTDETIISIHPNPLHDQSLLKINSSLSLICTVYFYNAIGQMVNYYQLENNEVLLQKEDFYPGIYFYQVRNEGSMIGSGKLVVD